ncbi:MAG: tRNA (adenosine(37)-N6)-dimethylallyltransferase MiaA [Deltaproteobacteria bacterium]|nr:tRNA (adenosine(37)-N6)-dimethylallyltransferase MiaA [Deltaproteobacteria bacterium]
MAGSKYGENVLIIAGPTGGGKSALAIQLATLLGGEIINADSVQVYRGAEIGSAKVSAEERERVTHHLLDICEPNEEFNTAHYQERVDIVISELISRGRLPIVAGGSTLYLTHLLHGIAELPDSDPELRHKLSQLSTEELFSELTEVDPDASVTLHRNDRVRIMRALESSISAGAPASLLLQTMQYGKPLRPAIIVVIVWPRGELYGRIERRTAAMMDAGLLSESKTLLEKFGPDIKIFRSLGYKQCLDYLQGRVPLNDVCSEIAKHTRRYAKRQLTFWRNEPAKRGWSVFPTKEQSHLVVDAGGAEGPGSSIAAFEYDKPELEEALKKRLSERLTGVEVWFVTPKVLE